MHISMALKKTMIHLQPIHILSKNSKFEFTLSHIKQPNVYNFRYYIKSYRVLLLLVAFYAHFSKKGCFAFCLLYLHFWRKASDFGHLCNFLFHKIVMKSGKEQNNIEIFKKWPSVNIMSYSNTMILLLSSLSRKTL